MVNPKNGGAYRWDTKKAGCSSSWQCDVKIGYQYSSDVALMYCTSKLKYVMHVNDFKLIYSIFSSLILVMNLHRLRSST